jgi:hypothetical protein
MRSGADDVAPRTADLTDAMVDSYRALDIDVNGCG